MANIDNDKPVASDSLGKEDNGKGSAAASLGLSPAASNIHDTSVPPSSPDQPPHDAPAFKTATSSTATVSAATETLKASTVPQPVIVQLNSSGTTVAPQPKKFSAVNINKMFLEKNSTPSHTTSQQSSSSLKSTGPVARPALAPSAHSSRLVTAKLTATPQPSTTTGPGWSRPSSAAPSSSTANGGPSQLQSGSHVKSSGPPALPHVGKVIQPQARAAGQASHSDLLPPSKPAWAKVGSARDEARAHSDFPTAAEVAQGMGLHNRESWDNASHPAGSRVVKEPVAGESSDIASAAHKQARMEEADTFRGVHLDPNASHWDEMEEDDNFFDSVVEFEDGRRYEVETAPTPSKPPTPPRKSSINVGRGSASQTHSRRDVPPVEVPINKEDRFADDFDRSWPRSSPSLSSVSGQHGTSNASVGLAPSPKSPAAPLHSLESSRVLFNERSNRLEPYSNTHRPGPGYNKRGGPESGPPDTKSNVQVLQKSSERPRGQMNGIPPGHRDFGRREPPPPGHNAAFNPPARLPGYAQVVTGERGRRMPNMGPPPVSNHAMRGSASHDSLPRPAWSPSNAFPGRVPSIDSKRPSAPPSSISAPSIRHPSQSPVLSHTSAAAISPIDPAILPPNTDLDELRKDVMQHAAARAKQRRQQEEEEREKERERAKQKAAELEARIKAAEAEKAAKEKSVQVGFPVFHFFSDAKALIQEEAVDLIEEVAKEAEQQPAGVDVPTGTPLVGRRPSFAGKSSLGLTDPRPSVQRRDSNTSHTNSITPSVSVESWRSHANPLPPPPVPRHVQTRPRKPSLVAPSIFDQVDTLTEDPEVELEVVDFSDLGKFVGVAEPSPEVPTVPEATPSQSHTAVVSRPVASDFFDEGDKVVQTPAKTGDTVQEAAMSALDDAMSRIKGALDGMQAHDSDHHPFAPTVDNESHTPLSLPSKQGKDRWIPPALRSRHEIDFDLREPFCTKPDPPRSPKPAWNTFTVRLPKVSDTLDPVSKKQLALFNRMSTLRWDILSFDPPVDGMTRKDFLVNDVLFRFPKSSNFYKGKNRYRVVLPRRINVPDTSRIGSFNSLKPSNSGAFGKSSVADDASSWRTMAPTAADTTPSTGPSEATTMPLSPARTERSKLPKMPAGSSVAFYRDSQVVNAEAESSAAVSFIMSSELEDTENAIVEAPASTSNTLVNGNATFSSNSVQSEKFELKAVQDSSTLSSHAAPWPMTPLTLGVKDSPARGPDPEHLKALWSSTSHTSELHPVNSLEGIADDLISMPFTLQDVKSEDGETPPPTMSASSRMSLHDVTRAFQQVPSSSSVTPHRPTISPPTTTAPVARPPPNYSYGVPMPPQPPNNQGMRPTYVPYPSPMLSHSPAPMVYTHPMTGSPVPARMQVNGHNPMTPMYGTPMWVPLPPSNAPGQTPMMRPYPQLMSYSPSAPAMYLPSPQSMPNMSPQNAHANSGRNMPVMMSPGVVHATPNMYGSPVMMHAGRVPMRNDSNQTHPPPPPANPYTPTNSFMRSSGW
ncbi:hypothetical protein BDZ89DRAFT_1130128 [Hymenopellis radicata]|nr:hypothetical protein BDZ89DRAFT_1130128 [Hymenopellis radicata]